MTLSIILSSLSLIGIVIILSYKVYQIRNGGIVVVEHHKSTPHFFLNKIKVFKDNLVWYIKRYSHFAILFIAKMWVLMVHFLKKKSRQNLPKVVNFISGLPADEAKVETKISSFLKVMSDYKQKIKKFKNRIAEKEKLENLISEHLDKK